MSVASVLLERVIQLAVLRHRERSVAIQGLVINAWRAALGRHAAARLAMTGEGR
jgi:hypothetical protein